MSVNKANGNFAEMLKKQYENRQEMVIGMFMRQERLTNPADYYLRQAREEHKK